jgi:AraC family transcriptional activator of pobA
LGLSRERLNRLTRAATGHPALELIQERMAREACRRLTYVAAPISALAFELGFDDAAYFCRFFKRRIGMSPRSYRRNAWTSTG